MKNIIYILAILFTTGLYAQDKPKEVIEETKVKTTKTKDSKETKEKKIAVTTKKEMTVDTKKQADHYENSSRVVTPMKITKTIKIDRDNDPFYDSETKVVSYNMNNNTYSFKRNNTGFTIAKSENIYGDARLTSVNGYYLLNTSEYSGIGYFNSEGNFVIEYYDKDKDAMVIKEFVSK